MFNLINSLTIVTGILTAWVYIDIIYLYGAFFITIPLATLAALITIIFAWIKKKYIIAHLNFAFAIIAIISFFVFPW